MRKLVNALIVIVLVLSFIPIYNYTISFLHKYRPEWAEEWFFIEGLENGYTGEALAHDASAIMDENSTVPVPTKKIRHWGYWLFLIALFIVAGTLLLRALSDDSTSPKDMAWETFGMVMAVTIIYMLIVLAIELIMVYMGGALFLFVLGLFVPVIGWLLDILLLLAAGFGVLIYLATVAIVSVAIAIPFAFVTYVFGSLGSAFDKGKLVVN